MDWISFFLGVGAIAFVNIIYALWAVPKKIKRIKNLEKETEDIFSGLEEKLNFMEFEHKEGIKLWEERAEEMRLELDKHTATRLELDKLTASVKLRKTCPACGHEFPLYIREE